MEHLVILFLKLVSFYLLIRLKNKLCMAENYIFDYQNHLFVFHFSASIHRFVYNPEEEENCLGLSNVARKITGVSKHMCGRIHNHSDKLNKQKNTTGCFF
jgi:hypothetical protein